MSPSNLYDMRLVISAVIQVITTAVFASPAPHEIHERRDPCESLYFVDCDIPGSVLCCPGKTAKDFVVCSLGTYVYSGSCDKSTTCDSLSSSDSICVPN